jgi:MFS family permease
LHTVVGANLGFLVYNLADGSSEDHLHAMYMFYAVVASVCVAVTIYTCRESPLGKDATIPGADDQEKGFLDLPHFTAAPEGKFCIGSTWLSPPITLKDVLCAYYIDPRKHKDFTLVFWSRTLYYFGCSVQTFFKFYLKDVVGIEDAEATIVKTAIVGQLCATVTAIPTGILSDRTNGMRKPYIYGACVVLALGNIANLFVRNETDVMVICGFLGAANGVYLAMDAALALDTLPSEEDAARFMGVWGIGCFLGGAVGPLLAGPVLRMCGENPTNPDAYDYSGYSIILSGAAACYVFSGYVLKCVGTQARDMKSG